MEEGLASFGAGVKSQLAHMVAVLPTAILHPLVLSENLSPLSTIENKINL